MSVTGELAQRAEAELGADDRRELEHARARRAGRRSTRAREQRLDRRRHLHRLGVDRELPLVVVPADDLVVDEHAHELAHEQRVAVGGRREPLDEPGGQPVGAEQPGGERLGGGGVEPVEREHVGDPPAGLGERRAHLAQLGPGEAQQQQRHVLDPLGEVLEEIEQQRLGPLDVVDHDDQRPVDGRRAHEAADRPERLLDRAGRRRADEAGEDVDEPVAVGARRRRGARRAAARADAGVGVVAEIRRRRGSAAAIGANVASPARSQRISNVIGAVVGLGRGAELAGQAGLADAGRAEHRDEPRRARRRSRSSSTATQPVHLGVAADERCRDLDCGRGGVGRDLVDRDRLRRGPRPSPRRAPRTRTRRG